MKTHAQELKEMKDYIVDLKLRYLESKEKVHEIEIESLYKIIRSLENERNHINEQMKKVYSLLVELNLTVKELGELMTNSTENDLKTLLFSGLEVGCSWIFELVNRLRSFLLGSFTYYAKLFKYFNGLEFYAVRYF